MESNAMSIETPYENKLGVYSALVLNGKFDSEGVDVSETMILDDSAFHAAIRASRPVKLLEQIVQKFPYSIVKTDNFKSTPLHQAAVCGNNEAAEFLVSKSPTMTLCENDFKETPLHMAAKYGHEETVRYLLKMMKSLANDKAAYDVKLLNYLIIAGFNDIALAILHRHPELAIGKERIRTFREEVGKSALETLAEKSNSFASGSQIGRGSVLQIISNSFSLVVAQICGYKKEAEQTINKLGKGDPILQMEEAAAKKRRNLLSQVQERVFKRTYAIELAKKLVREIISRSESEDDIADRLVPPLISATKLGIYELVTVIIKHCPPLILIRIDNEGRSIFHLSVIHRQEKVFNLLYQMTTQRHIVTAAVDKKDRNLLHMAAMLGPLDRVSGAALQMQREMQWFKEVKERVQPSYSEKRIIIEPKKLSLRDVEVIVQPKSGEEIISYPADEKEKTPEMIFSETHKDLMKEGEEWMKTTATSYTVVAALVVTVMFAAAFTAPGGNDDNGLPLFLTKRSFQVFAVSDAVALFSSTTSLIMFLGILTSRYSEEDFLDYLPSRLCIGLISLFVSIAGMLVAFCATFYIVFYHKIYWVAAPLALFACVPVGSFVLMQFPLLLELLSCTFGRGIFYKQNPETIF